MVGQAAYWFSALRVAECVYAGDGEPVWRSGPAGSFFPWPKEPGMLTVLTPMSATDQFVYGLIASGAYVPLTVMISVFLGYLGWVIGKRLGRVER